MIAAQIPNRDYISAIAEALGRAVGRFKKPPAIIHERTGRSVGAAKKWLGKENGPGGAELVELMREFDEVFEAVCEMAGRAPPAHLTPDQRIAATAALKILTGDA